MPVFGLVGDALQVLEKVREHADAIKGCPKLISDIKERIDTMESVICGLERAPEGSTSNDREGKLTTAKEKLEEARNSVEMAARLQTPGFWGCFLGSLIQFICSVRVQEHLKEAYDELDKTCQGVIHLCTLHFWQFSL